MSLSRRNFVRTVGLGSAGLSTAFVIGRGREAVAFEGAAVQALQPPDDGLIHIDSNENARGPGQSSIDALHHAISARVGRGYPPDYVGELGKTIAARYGVDTDRVIIGTGSGLILEAGARAFCSPTKPLVTGAPSYAQPEGAAKRVGAEVKALPVDKELKLDLDAMADAAKGAGMVFFCNPNNPTATAHRLTAVEQFVRRVKQSSPDTAILIDEAYIDYVYDPGIKTAIPLTQEFPGVFVNLGRPAAEFRDACRKLGVAVGRDFPPMEKTHNRISLGTMDEMRKSVDVFQKVLGRATNL